MRIPVLETNPRDKALVLIPKRNGALDAIKALVLDACHSSYTRAAYETALDEFLNWYQANGATALTKAVVNQYRARLEGERGLSPASVNKQLAAIRKLVNEGQDNGLLDSDTAAAIRRVKGAKRSGTRLGNWLSLEQAQELIEAPDRETIKGKRDLAILAILLGAGLRRTEAAALTVEHVQQREGRWVIVDLVGKHNRTRSVPIASWVKVALDRWTTAVAISADRIFRSVNKSGHLGATLSAQGLYKILVSYAQQLGIKDLAPHDLRRTFAQLARKSGSNIEQIQRSLGHASVLTTERYLGTQQDLADAPSDRIRLKVA